MVRHLVNQVHGDLLVVSRSDGHCVARSAPPNRHPAASMSTAAEGVNDAGSASGHHAGARPGAAPGPRSVVTVFGNAQAFDGGRFEINFDQHGRTVADHDRVMARRDLDDCGRDVLQRTAVLELEP